MGKNQKLTTAYTDMLDRYDEAVEIDKQIFKKSNKQEAKEEVIRPPKRASTTDNLDNAKPSTQPRARSKSVSSPRLGGRVPLEGAKPRKNADDDLKDAARAKNDLEADLKNAARARNDSIAKAAAAEKAKVELVHRKEGLSLALSRMVNHANTVHKRSNNADLLDFKWAADMAKAGDQGALIAVEDWLIGRGYAKKDERGNVSINQSLWEAEGFEKTYKTAVRAYNAINRLEGKNQEEKRVVNPIVVDPTARDFAQRYDATQVVRE
jgi:hypothetical protein